MSQTQFSTSEYPSDTDLLDTASRVLSVEAEALAHLAEHLPEDFTAAIHTILNARGRTIVSGIGKSGHIGRKIAATLASTGTPAYFVHCAEASHGDLGMITPDDVCVLISNSGETSELRDLVYHTQRFSIPMIGVSSNPDSTLMKAADHRLTLPKLPEACSIGMAPTTSTTLTLALGDALAVALMERRSFKSEDFGIFHPGGKLGAQMCVVSDLMHTGEAIPTLDLDASIEDMLLVMTSKSFGIAALLDQNTLYGVVTDGDLRRNIDTLMQSTPRDLANRTPVTVQPDMLAPEALGILNQRKISALLVVDADNKPVGVLNIHDFLRAGIA